MTSQASSHGRQKLFLIAQMLIPIVVLLLPVAVFALYRYFLQKSDARALWRSAVIIGSSVGILRSVLACIGWYGVEHTGGPLQIPAFVLAMLAWPEGFLLGRHRGVTPVSVYAVLAVLLFVTSLLLVTAVAFAARVIRSRAEPTAEKRS